ncbi:MAG: M48 family metallopeptidase [Proteobacteria bacterium]|nr:M48 family metallopeptidase [Pseudomonadota bacterium]
MKYRPLLPQHNDNVSHDQPVREFVLLFSGIMIFLLIAFWVLGMFIDLAVGYLSPEMEAVIFSSVSPSKSDLVDDSDPRQAELQHMVNELQKCSQVTYPLKVYLINSDDANALAFPGGRMLVFDGLLDKVSSKNGLSFVLAHELAHFKNRDHLRGMGRGIVFTAVAALITGPGSDLTQLFAPTSGFSQARYSQKRESLADQQALQVLGCYYGHVGGATEFFEAMKANDTKSSKMIAHYFASHPDAVQRINNLHRLAKNHNLVVKEILPLPEVLNVHK